MWLAAGGAGFAALMLYLLGDLSRSAVAAAQGQTRRSCACWRATARCITERGGGDDYVPLDLLPRHVADAVIATEDQRFYDHRGVDPLGMLRAALANLREGRFVQGGSTLTQQLAKNLYLSSDRTFARKLEEFTLALWLESRLSKADILELYLNRVYLGSGAYGIDAAAQRYFGKSARNLTLGEAAMIAGLLKAPSKYSPLSNPDGARRARAPRAVADAGCRLHHARQERKAAVEISRSFDRSERAEPAGAEYAVDYVLEQLAPAYVMASPPVRGHHRRDDARPQLQAHAAAIVEQFIASRGQALATSEAAVGGARPRWRACWRWSAGARMPRRSSTAP